MRTRFGAGLVGVVVLVGCSSASNDTIDGGIADAATFDGSSPPGDANSDAGSVTIGSAGGELEVDGVHLSIPAGALSSEVTIEISFEDESEAPSDIVSIRSIVRFAPAGTVFSIPATLTVEYDEAAATEGTPSLFYTAAGEEDHFELDETATVEDGTATTTITHFSRLIIGYPGTSPSVVDLVVLDSAGAPLQPQLVVFRDGDDAQSWIPLTGGSGIFHATPTSPSGRYGLAVLCDDLHGEMYDVLLSEVDDLIVVCDTTPTGYAVNGAVTGIDTDMHCAVAHVDLYTSSCSDSWNNMTGAPAGNRDLVISRYPIGASAPDAFLFMRGLTLSALATWNTDLSSPVAADVRSVTTTVPSGSPLSMVYYHTERRTSARLQQFNATTYGGVPVSAQAVDESHELNVYASATSDFRTVFYRHFFRAPIALPDAITMDANDVPASTTLALSSVTPPVLSASFPDFGANVVGYVLGFRSQTGSPAPRWAFVISKGVAGNLSTYDLESPDLTGVTGWTATLPNVDSGTVYAYMSTTHSLGDVLIAQARPNLAPDGLIVHVAGKEEMF